MSIDDMLRDLARSCRDEPPTIDAAVRRFTSACRRVDDDPREQQRISDIADLLDVDAEGTFYDEALAEMDRGEQDAPLSLWGGGLRLPPEAGG